MVGSSAPFCSSPGGAGRGLAKLGISPQIDPTPVTSWGRTNDRVIILLYLGNGREGACFFGHLAAFKLSVQANYIVDMWPRVRSA